MASMVIAAIESSEDPSFGPELRPAEAQPAPEICGVRSERSSDCLERISSGIYARAVSLHYLESSEDSSFWPELPPAEAQPAPEICGVRSERGSDCLDRISSGICERAVRLQLRELQQLVRLCVAREFRPEIADLKEQIKECLALG